MFNDKQILELSGDLKAEAVRKRPDSGMTYIEGYYVINTANEIFGFDGWKYAVDSLTFNTNGKYGIFQAIVTVTINADGTVISRSEVGFGIPAGESAQAYETAGKAAVTDGMKRAFRTFGPRFGNDLYDKDNPLHNLGTVAAPSADATAPAPVTTTKRNDFRKTLAPVAATEPIHCETCNRELKPTVKYKVADIVRYSTSKCDGHVLCYDCQQKYPQAVAPKTKAA